MSTVTEWEISNMADIVNVGFKVDTSQIEKGYNRFNKMGKVAESAEKKTSSALGSIGKSAGQAGIQIQQFVGQVQMGTSPLVAMSQQAADLGIVLGAPLLGAITGIAASLGTVLLPSLFDADDATDKLKETLEAIDKVAVQTAGGTFTLTEEIARLAKVSETAANAQIALSITEATQAINLARESASDAVSELDDLFNGFDVVSTPDMIDKLNAAMGRTGLSASELIETTNLYATGLTQVKSFSKSLNNSLGTTTEQSIQLIRAVSQFRSGGSVSDLANTFSEVSLSAKGATKEFQSLAVQLNAMALTTEKSESVLTLLKEAMGDLDGILNNSESAVNDIIDSFVMKTEALHADEVQMAKNIAMQAAGADATEAEKEKIESAIDAYYRKLNAIRAEEKAQRDARVEREKAAREAEREAEAIQRAADKQAQAYSRWIEQVKNAVDPTIKLQEEIYDLWLAMFAGDIDEDVATARIKQLEEQIASFKDVAKDSDVNPYEGLASGAMEYLTAIQMLSKDGSDSFKELERAIAALSITQSLATGNIAGAIASGASLLTTFDKGLGDDISAEIQANQNLDDLGEKADSISIATKTTADATDKLVGINTKMLNALKTVQNGITGASGMVARDRAKASIDIGGLGILDNLLTSTGLGSFLTDALDIFNKFTFNFLGSVGSSIFKSIGGLLGGSSKVKDEGIRIIGGSLSQLMDDVTVQAFQKVKYKKWRFGSSKTKTKFIDAGNSVGNQFSLVFESIADSVAAGADILGISQDEIEKRINSFRISTQTISLKGLSASRQQKEIEAYFSRVFNNLSVSVIPFIRELQVAGEELGETLSRVATQTSIAEYLIDNFGVTFADKVADPRAFAIAADNLANFAGGAEALAEQVSSFTDAFASDTTKLNIYQESLVGALRDVGLSLPSASEGLFDLMSSLDGTTEAGQEQIATLLKVTGTADAYYKLLDNTAGRYREAAESLFDVSFAVEKVALDSAVAAARLGDFSLAEALDLKSLTPSKSDFSSLIDYNVARAETAAKLNELADLQTGKVSVDEKQLNVLEQIRDSLQNQATKEADGSMISKLTEQMTALKSEFQEVSRQLRYGTITTTQEA